MKRKRESPTMSESDILVYRRLSKLELYPFAKDLSGFNKTRVNEIIDRAPDSAATETVEIIDMIKGGRGKGAQVLRVRGVGSKHGALTERILKVFDPPFYVGLR
jgi:hypothetical protein